MAKGFIQAVGAAALLAVGAAAFLYVGQTALLYPRPAAGLPDTLPPRVERINLDPGYGLLVMPDAVAGSRAPLVIYAHGNAEIAYWSVEAFDALVEHGYAVLLIEYPGYAGAAGTPGYESIRQTVVAAYDAMAARPGIDPGAIVAYGRSMGGGAACLLAAERELAALVLESTFASLPELVGDLGFPSMLLRDRYENASVLSALEIPVFVFHGRRDSLIPLEHGEALRRAGADVTFVTADCGHNDCARPWAELIRFLDRQARDGTLLQ